MDLKLLNLIMWRKKLKKRKQLLIAENKPGNPKKERDRGAAAAESHPPRARDGYLSRRRRRQSDRQADRRKKRVKKWEREKKRGKINNAKQEGERECKREREERKREKKHSARSILESSSNSSTAPAPRYVTLLFLYSLSLPCSSSSFSEPHVHKCHSA